MAIANTNTEMTRINPLAALTWHRLKVNNAPVRLEDPASVNRAECRIEGNTGADHQMSELSGILPGALSDNLSEALSEIRTGAGEAFADWIRKTEIEAVRISADDNSEPVRMHIGPAETVHTAVLPVEITVEDNKELTVIMKLTDAAKPCRGALAVQTRIKAGAGARVKLVQLQLTKYAAQVYTDIGADAGENARIEIVQLFAGGADVYAGSEIALRGDGSSSQVYIGYQGAGEGKLDFNYNAVHIGKNTDSGMTVNGVLRDSSQKTFRGTIDFKTGSSGAVGAETEDVLLLG